MSKPLLKFVQKRKSHLVEGLNKSDTVLCSDCEGVLIKNDQWVGCVCFGDLKKGITLIKTEKSVKVEFSEEWDKENISLLLEVLRNKNKSL